MNLPKELTTDTPLSKYLAMVVFAALPIVGFLLGMRYQEMLNLAKRQQMEANLSIPRIPTPTPIVIPTVDPSITANWKTYTNSMYRLFLKYPPEFVLEEKPNKSIQFIVKLTTVDKELTLDIQTEDIPNWPGNTGYEEIKTLNGVQWKVFAESEYCDAGECSRTPIIYRTSYKNKSYHFILTNIDVEFVDQILSTFKFLP